MKKDYPTLVHHIGKNSLPEYTLWLTLDDYDFPNFNVELLSPVPEKSWVEYEIESCGTESLIGSPWHCVNDFNIGLVDFAITHGLSIRQPFAIRAGFVSTRTYEGEYDAWIEWEIVAKEPVRDKLAARRYERWAKEFPEYVQQIFDERARRAIEVWTRPDKMFLRSSWYFAPGDSWYDDMSAPSGVSITLWSNLYEWPQQLMEGHDDGGNHQKAFDQLVKKVAEKNNTIDLTKLSKRW